MCDERSYTALGKKSIAHAAKIAGYERSAYRQDGKIITRYVCNGWPAEDLLEIRTRWGMFQKFDSDVELETTPEVNDSLNQLLALDI